MHGISRIALIAALAAPLAAPSTATAQEDGGQLLGTITLTASTEPVETGRTGATVSIVTEEDLKKTGDLSVANQLARLPGVSMTRSGGLGTSTALRLRGLSGPYIGVRIDGIDVADPSGTQCAYDFGSTMLGGISRIEVLRGSQSAIYGSEAVGGVVDITTFRPTEQGTTAEVGVEAGADSTLSGVASVGLLTDRVELAFSASRTITDGISSFADGTEDDAFRASTLTFYGSYKLSDTLTLGLNGIWRDSYTEFDSQTGDNDQSETGELRGIRAFAQLATGAVTHELSYSHTDTLRYYPLGFVQTYEGGRDQIAYKGGWDASEALSLNWGLDRTEEDFGSDFESGTAETTSVWAEALYAPTDRLDLSVALRNDDHETFGSKVTGRVALAFRPTEEWVFRAVASTGFRAPSLYELYSAYGDTGLQPETSRTFELGAEYILPGDDGQLGVTLFDTAIEDMIGFDFASTACASGFGCYNQIPGTTTTRGLELTGNVQVATGWSVFGNYTYTDAVTANAGTETRLVRVPRHDLTLGVEGQLTDRLSGILAVQHVADFTDTGVWPDPASKMPDYTVANLTVTYDLNEETQAYLRVENLFDEDYETVRNYGQPGRQLFVGLRASF